ncbi:MAG: hypothetical protein LH610_00355 [Sphingomonas bacterium]|nr:hypothetical protein [Sphingomonas bacterium]
MNHDHDQNDTGGQSGIDQETERRNRENETGEQSQQPQAGQQSDTLTTDQTQTEQPQAEQPEGDSASGFVGSAGDQSSDYLTKGENQDFAPEGQGATDTDAGTSDIETGESSNVDSALDDGADTSR